MYCTVPAIFLAKECQTLPLQGWLHFHFPQYFKVWQLFLVEPFLIRPSPWLVDDFDFLNDLVEGMGFGQFGGNLSVQKPTNVKPLMIFGQDESVYTQYLLSN